MQSTMFEDLLFNASYFLWLQLQLHLCLRLVTEVPIDVAKVFCATSRPQVLEDVPSCSDCCPSVSVLVSISIL